MTRRTQAILFDQPGLIATRPLQLKEREANEALVAIEVSAISTGTERLAPNRWESFSGPTSTTNREAAAATTRSRTSAPPCPLMRL